ncbi:MAG: outer membrane protein assembly factor BamD [Deltaproteobacteria bacterium]|nr:outer membrane protein assembly factor BamD [Deltaproteobacteria bacterium]
MPLNFYRLLPFLALLVFVSSCNKSSGFSLASSRATRDSSECLILLEKKKYEKAINCFEAFKSTKYGSPEAAEAELAVADAYFLKKDYLVAAEAYKLFTTSHPHHPKVPYAYMRSGVSYLENLPKGIDRDMEGLDEAIEMLGTVIKYYGGSIYAEQATPYYQQARTRQAKKHYYVGRYYYKSREYLAAIPRFQSIVTDYPKLGLDEKSFYYLIVSLSKTGNKELAGRYFQVYEEFFPKSSLMKKSKKILSN